MSNLSDLLKSLSNNMTNSDVMAEHRLGEIIKAIISTQPSVADKNIWNKSDKEGKSSPQEEMAAITGVAGYGAIEIRQGASMEEIIATKKCMGYIDLLNSGGLSKEAEKKIRDDLEEAKKHLQEVREKYDGATEYLNDTVKKATQVIKNIKSPQYIADEKKRKGLFKSLHYGIDDPFYDSLKKIYGEEGLEGYRKERKEAFENISNYDVALASKRYKRVNNAFTCVKTLAQLGTWIASWFVLYPHLIPSGCNPLIFGLGMAMITKVAKFSEYNRSVENYQILDARLRVAKDLGLLEKNKSISDIEKSDYE